jgi:predicted transcriptional regulator
MEQLLTILEELWLEESECQVYYLCLKYWKLSVSTLSRMSNIPRSTIHDIVEKLHLRAFLLSHKEKRGYTYSSISADEIISMLERKEASIRKSIDAVKSQKDIFEKSFIGFYDVPKINYYEWLDALQLIYSKYRAAKENYSFFDIDKAMQYTWYDLAYFVDIGKKHIGNTKDILIYSENAKKYAKAVKGKWYQVKFIKAEDVSIESDNILFDGLYYHISFGTSIVAIEINNPIFYKTQKLLFESLRDRL